MVSADSLSTGYLLRWMFGFLGPVKPLAFIACVYLAGWQIAETLAIRQVGLSINNISSSAIMYDVQEPVGFWRWFFGVHPFPSALRIFVLWLLIYVVLNGIFRYFREVAYVKLSMTLVFYIREGIYDKLQRVGFGFHDAMSTGQLINRALSDLQNVRSFVQTAVLTTLEILLAVGLNLALIMERNFWLAILSLIPLPLWTWYIIKFSRRVQPAAKAVMEAEDSNVSVITENIAGVHVIKAFAAERQEMDKYAANCNDFKTRVLHRIRLFANFNPIIRSIATASFLLLFWVGGILKVQGRILAGDLTIIGGAMNAILSRLQAVATINEQYQNAIVSARRLHEVLTASPTVPEKPDAILLPPGIGLVEFAHVTFGYDAAKPILHDISFTAPGGKVIAIVGPTGAGKSSLLNLISRFYDPQQGSIRIDGVDLRDATHSSLRTQIGVVFQETYLFSDTIANNIAYGRPHISRGDIEAAARLAQAHEFIETMPKGYDSILSERGQSLSGGQRQRLAIARAILTNPRILLLDDATAAVDPETEDLIRRGMSAVMKNRTTLVIAHRISTVKRADLVIVVEQGRITQMGTHAQLMEEPGHYREIARVQLQADDTIDQAEHPSHMKRLRNPQNIATVADAAKDERLGMPEDNAL
jgi:ATP-binding cassette subfamily B protein